MKGLNAVEIVSDYRSDAYRGIIHSVQRPSLCAALLPEKIENRLQDTQARRRMNMSKRAGVEKGCGNVFADIGMSNPDEALAKAEIARRINCMLAARKLSQVEAGKILGIPQPRVSDLARGRLGKFSLEKLIDFAKRLGNDVEIRLKPSRSPRLKVA